MTFCIVHYAKLAGGNTLLWVLGMNAVHIAYSGNFSLREFRRMADLEGDLLFIVKIAPDIFCDKIESLQLITSPY